MTDRDLAAVLARWGELRPQRLPPVLWGPAAAMIAAAERDAKSAGIALDELLETSAAEFPQIGEPLLLDFGAHRWLREENEPAYSAWLAWILEQRNDSGAILSLFGREPGEMAGRPCEVECEVVAPEGRLDIVVRCDGTSTFAIEVKTQAEPEEDQLDRYVRFLSREKHPLGLVLLAVSTPESLVPNGWSFQSWADIALGLRTWAAEGCRRGSSVQAALTLAFCGAVEQNLLGYSRGGINTPDTVRHIESWLTRCKHGDA